MTLTGCVFSTASPVTDPEIVVPEELQRPCRAQRLPRGDMTAAQVSRLWGLDRVQLAVCESRRDGLHRLLDAVGE